MQELDDYINRVKGLPTAPRLLPQLLQLLRQTNCDSARIVRLISVDPALTAHVLRLCNSSWYAGSATVIDLHEAVTRLGFQEVYRLVAAVIGARTLSPAQNGYGIDQGELWQHSVTAATAAQLIARNAGEDEQTAFTAGLLHDIGKLVLSQALEEKYAQLMQETGREQLSLLEAERRILGVQHAEVGGRLLARWNFPPNLVTAVWFHHHPQSATPHQRLAACTYLGNLVAYFLGFGFGHQAFALRARADALEILGLRPEDLPPFMIQTFERMEELEALFNIATPPCPAAP